MAEELGLTGYVRNLSDQTTVEVVAEGERERLNKLLDFLKTGPPAARVDTTETEWHACTGKYKDFAIRH